MHSYFFINIYFKIIAYILDIKSEQIEIKLEYCGCKRQIRKKELISNSERNLWINQTTCGIDAFTRGMNQKVIGMSLFWGSYHENIVSRKTKP